MYHVTDSPWDVFLPLQDFVHQSSRLFFLAVIELWALVEAFVSLHSLLLKQTNKPLLALFHLTSILFHSAAAFPYRTWRNHPVVQLFQI